MVGRVGKDDYGRKLLDSLADFCVDPAGVTQDPERPTGSALIIVDSKGENSIVVSPGANSHVSKQDIDRNAEMIQKAKFLLLQYEIPLETVFYAAETARKYGVKVILNPAPYQAVVQTLINHIDFLVLNEVEASALLGKEIHDVPSCLEAIHSIPEIGLKTGVITLGSQGCVVTDGQQTTHISSVKVNAVDSTAAGDAFIGGFACGLLSGRSVWDSARFANVCGAVTVTRAGAQTSLPTMADVTALLNDVPVDSIHRSVLDKPAHP
jgi:ribokinase